MFVDQQARIITDENSGYTGLGREFAGGHETTNHGRREYVKPGTDIHSKTIEGFLALLKRGIIGTSHNVSREDLHRYLDEFAFRYNSGDVDDDERVGRLVRSADGKRLMYKKPVRLSA